MTAAMFVGSLAVEAAKSHASLLEAAGERGETAPAADQTGSASSSAQGYRRKFVILHDS